MRTPLWLAAAVALWPCLALAQHGEAKASPKAELKTDAHVTVQGKAPATPAAHPPASSGHQPSIAPVLGQIAPPKPPAPERPAGTKPAVADHAAAKPAAEAPSGHEPVAGKHGKPEAPVEALPQTARRGRPAGGAPSVNDVAASINQRLAELAELRRTMPGALRRPAASKKREEEGAAVAASPVAVKPAETPKFRIELQWRVPVMWPDELLTTGMS